MNQSPNYLKPINTVVTILLLIYMAVMPVASVQAAATTRYVDDTTGNDSSTCTSSGSPCKTIQNAVNKSVSGDTILVAKGTYAYSSVVDTCASIKPSSVICFKNKSLTILGGFSTSNWSTANPSGNLTVIDGNDFYRGVYVFKDTSTARTLDMEGFTIQHGRAQSPSTNSTAGLGGGMLVQSVTIILRDMVFTNNQSIGPDTSSGAPGQADGAGLRIQSAPGSASLLQRVIFDNNQSYGGTGAVRGGIAFGALFIYASTVTVEDSSFTNNTAQGGNSTGSGVSGGLHADALGGAIAIEACNTITMRRITIAENHIVGGNASSSNGVAGGAFGAAIVVEDTPSFYLSDSIVENNIATGGTANTGGNSGGGAIHAANNGEVTIERVQVNKNYSNGGNGSSSTGNAGPGAGGGLYLFATKAGTHHATLNNVIIADNQANQGSVGVTATGNGGAGGLMIQGINADVNHATIVRNQIGANMVLGQGLVVQPWVTIAGNLNLNNSIIADHTGGNSYAAAIVVDKSDINNSKGTLTFNHGLFAGNTRNINNDSMPVAPGTINGLSTMSSASTAGFVSAGAPNYNYHIRGDSPAKDQATTSTTPDDIDGQSRPYNVISDFGADEYWPLGFHIYLPLIKK